MATPGTPAIPIQRTTDILAKVQVEHAQLRTKFEDLGAFLSAGQPDHISHNEWFRLNVQYGAMQVYLDILDERLRRAFL